MNDKDQLPLIREFMRAVAPEVLRFQHESINEADDYVGLPERVAEISLEIAMHMAANYARCAKQLCYGSLSEKDPTAFKESGARKAIARIRLPRENIPVKSSGL